MLVVPESGHTFSKLGQGWITAAYISKEIKDTNLQHPKLKNIGQPEIIEELDIALYDVDLKYLDVEPPKIGQDVVLTGYPINSFFPKSFKGNVLFQNDDDKSWTVLMDDNVELPIGIASGIVRDERTKTKLGIMLYHSPPTDIDGDKKKDYSYPLLAFSDAYNHLSKTPSLTYIPYDPDFVGDIEVGLPTLISDNLVGDELDGKVLDYVHYSLVMDERQAMPLYVAYNIDRDQLIQFLYSGGEWAIDDRVSHDLQKREDIYKGADWERGHLACRSSLAWGTNQEASDASGAAYFYTNSVPQHESFNQSNWHRLEDFVMETYRPNSSKISLLTGPVHRKSDLEYRSSRIPRSFWKIVIANDPSNSRNIFVSAYLMDQYTFDEQNQMTPVPPIRVFYPDQHEISIAELEKLTSLNFGILKNYDSTSIE